jgi:hypothetical protein
LAAEFGIDAPLPAMVSLSAELLDAAGDTLRQWGVTLRPGHAVGLELRRGLTPLNRYVPLEGGAYQADALRIYAFDMLVQNPDRRVENPNCGNFKGRLVAYDHEMAFSFLHPIVGAGHPWEVPRFSRQHLFHGFVAGARRRGAIDWDPIKDAVRTVSERVEGLVEYLPDAWRGHGERVATHIQAVATNTLEFQNGLENSLL